MKRISLVILGLLALSLIAGCQEEQKVWGKGDPPMAYQEIFGNDPTARLNYVQTQQLDRNSFIIYGVEGKDPNGQPIRKRGLIERITALEDRVKKIEDTYIQRYDPND